MKARSRFAAEEIPVNLQFPRATPEGTVVLRGAKVITMRGDEVIENTVRYVMKNGQLFDGDTLDEVWPSQKAMAKSWWSSDGPVDSSKRN